MALKIRISRTYNWLEKNPVIDKLRTVLQDVGLYEKHKREMLHQLTGVAVATFDGWFDGDTLSPQSRTVQMTIKGIGYEIAFQPAVDNWNIERELTKAAKWNLANSKSVSKAALEFAKKRLNGKTRAKATKPKQGAYHAAQSKNQPERRVSRR